MTSWGGDRATERELGELANRILGEYGDMLSSLTVAKIHQLINDAKPDTFPDTDSQTKQAKWVARRIKRDIDPQ